MARTIQSVPEMYTVGIDDLGGGAREMRWYMRVVFQGEDPAGEWHFYGVEPDPQQHPNAVTHAPTHFPAMMDMTLDQDALLYDLAYQAERNALEA